jgi:hypothetical protein
MLNAINFEKFLTCGSSLRGAQRRGNLYVPRLLHFVRNDETEMVRLKSARLNSMELVQCY